MNKTVLVRLGDWKSAVDVVREGGRAYIVDPDVALMDVICVLIGRDDWLKLQPPLPMETP